MTCARCGAPLDPDHVCVQHETGCGLNSAAPDDDYMCDCMNVCPDCCRTLGCPLQDEPARPPHAPSLPSTCSTKWGRYYDGFHVCRRPTGHDGRCVCICGSWTARTASDTDAPA